MARRAGTAATKPASGRRKRSRRARPAALVAIAVAISAVIMVTLSAQAIAAHASCANHPVLLNVAVTDDLAPAVEQVAQNFNRQDHTARGRCTQVQITEDQSAVVASRIDGQASGKGLPSVDAWIPESSLWVDVARSFPLGAQAVAPTGVQVAQSPLMIAMPRRVATETHAFDSPVSWNMLLPAADGGLPASLGLKVDLPDPTDSAAGLATLVELTRLLGPGAAARASFTKFVLSSAATSQFDDPASLATFVSTADAPFNGRPVTVTSEQAVIDYDRANPSRPLAAQYPSDTAQSSLGSPNLDYPYVLTTSSPPELAAAREFEQALQQPFAESVIRYDGFRTTDGTTDATPASFGLKSQVLQQATMANASEAQTTLEVWGKLGLGSRDLVLIDVSSAMAQPDGNGAETLEQELAKTAVLGLALFPDSTQMGQWLVADKLKPHQPYEETVGIGPLPAEVGLISRRQQLAQIDATLHPGRGGQALNASILAAYKQMLATYKPNYSNAVVVLTSGVDGPGDMSTSALLKHLHALYDPNRRVEIVIDQLGTAGDFAALKKIADLTGGGAYEITNPKQIGKVFIEAFSHRLCNPTCAAP